MTLLAATGPGASEAAACACCSEPGQRLELTVPLDSGLRDELAHLRAVPRATLFADAGFPDSVKGVEQPTESPYRLGWKLDDALILLDLTHPAGYTGRISFALPREVSRFEVDTRRGGVSPGGGPSLYKEWRLTGDATLAGMFASAATSANARLVLHGGGNSCTSASDFLHWTLTVTGRGVAFTLLGEMARN